MALDAEKVRLAIAPIAWTNDDMPELGGENTFEQCVSEMALAGFSGSEIGNKYPKDPVVLKKALDLRGMQICNCWFSTFFTTGQKAETIAAFEKQTDFLRAVGARVIGCSEQGGGIQGKPLPIFGAGKPVFTNEQWALLFEGMNELGAIAKAKGMKACLHHHMGTGIQTPAEIDRFMAGVSGDVYLLFDSGHVYFSEGSQDAVDAVLDKHIGRIAHVHLKDVRGAKRQETLDKRLSFLDAVRGGTFTVPGDGDVSFGHIFDVLEKSGYEGWLVVEAEQDPAIANPLEYALMARRYIHEKTGL